MICSCGGQTASDAASVHWCVLCGQKVIKDYVGSVQETLDMMACAKGKCTCHERDSSFTCPLCKSEGYYGHMESPDTDTAEYKPLLAEELSQ
jgi:hypothetical protein